MRKAVVDVGSNSLILTVSELNNGTWTPIIESTRVTGLGVGTKATGLLSEVGITESLSALREFKLVATEQGADEMIAAGTMAVRIAENQADFLGRAASQGTPVQVLSGDDEARLGFLAVANDPIFGAHPRISIIDPGGNSTELVTADRTPAGWSTRFRKSFPVGALGLRDGVLRDESPGPSARLAAVAELDNTISMDYLPNSAGVAVVLGATGTNLISIRERLSEWRPELVHGAVLDYEEVGRAVGWLCGMTDSERAAVPGLQSGRERTIHIGALILERFLHSLRVWECRVSIRGWRHALLEGLE